MVVLSWNVPSSVSAHLAVANGSANSTLLKAPLNLCSEVLSRPAEAGTTKAPKRIAAPAIASSTCLMFISTSLCVCWAHTRRVCAQALRIYISEIEILVELFDTVMEPESLVNVPSTPRHSAPVGILPLMPASEMTCVTGSRWKVMTAGLVTLLLPRQPVPPDSLTRQEALTICAMIDLISGSVPSNPEYLMCHGNVSVRIVATPEVHEPNMALVIYPTSDPSSFMVVLSWNEPSTVT
jgi:hypothetical protein